MKSEKILHSIILSLEKMNGNNNGYISAKNMSNFIDMLKNNKFIGDILISSFLIWKPFCIYEMLCLELNIEVKKNFCGLERIKVTGEYLEEEHTKNLDRKIIVGVDSYDLLEEYMQNFLKNIYEIANKEKEALLHKSTYKGINNAEVFFEIY